MRLSLITSMVMFQIFILYRFDESTVEPMEVILSRTFCGKNASPPRIIGTPNNSSLLSTKRTKARAARAIPTQPPLDSVMTMQSRSMPVEAAKRNFFLMDFVYQVMPTAIGVIRTKYSAKIFGLKNTE